MARSHQYRNGLIHYAPDFAFRGYSLFCGGSPASAYLIDMEGRFVHCWSHPLGIGYANLLPNGNLLCRGVADFAMQARRGLFGLSPCVYELDWNGNVVWKYEDEWLHHDHERLPNGHTLALAWRQMPKALSKRVRGGIREPADPEQMLGDVVLEIDAAGKLVQEWRLYDHLDVREDVICPIEHRLEWTHANSVYATPDGAWLVSLRRVDTVVAIDPKAGRVKWKWGRGTISHQHDARMLANGNITVFDNGVHRTTGAEFSRALEVDPTKNEIVWSYEDEPPFHFYSFMGGAVERLPNGNTLICHSSVGRFFEVTPGKEIVWEYVNPFFVRNPRMWGSINITFRVHRYGVGHPALAGRDLDPARHANLNRLYAV